MYNIIRSRDRGCLLLCQGTLADTPAFAVTFHVHFYKQIPEHRSSSLALSRLIHAPKSNVQLTITDLRSCDMQRVDAPPPEAPEQ